MIHWSQIPMVRLIVPFIAGILAAIHLSLQQPCNTWVLPGIYLVNAFLLLFGYLFISFKMRWLTGVGLQIMLFIAGMQMPIIGDLSESPGHYRNAQVMVNSMVARVIEPVSATAKSYKSILDCRYLFDTAGFHPFRGRLLVYFEQDERAASLNYGDLLLVCAKWQPIEPPANPAEFDYQQHMEIQGVYDRAYIPADQWKKLDENQGNPIFALSYLLQGKILGILHDTGLQGEEFDVAAAILAGHRASLDPELQQAFTGAGAMHILCVSGLHVGVIYLVLSSLLGFLSANKKTRAMRNILLISLIWLYALVTGCAPSVMRAATMITFLIIGKWLNRTPNIYNTLAASAFFLLLIDPRMVMAIGFQLSYLAVTGIVSLQPFLYRSVFVKFWLLDKAWAITTVSVAAQLGTFPLAMYYFHQFPNYFILTNLLVIPASSLIIYLGFITLFTSSWPWLSQILGSILSYAIYGMNQSIFWINEIPGAVSGGLYISSFDCILIYLVTLSGVVMIAFRKKKMIFVMLTGILLLLLSLGIRKHENTVQRQFWVYALRGHRVYDFVIGTEHVLIVDSVYAGLPSKLVFHLGNQWIRSGLDEPVILDDQVLNNDTIIPGFIYTKRQFVQFSGQRILFIEQNEDVRDCPFRMEVDIIVLSNSAKLTVDQISGCYSFSLLVFDASNSRWAVESWKEACNSLELTFHDVLVDGAFGCNPGQ